MLSNKSNKELVEAGHQFAKALDADMPLTEIAKLVSALSTRLDCAIVRGDELQQKLDAMGPFIQPHDLKALLRFNETSEDGEGYDIGSESMSRLVELGLASKGAHGIRSITPFGRWVVERSEGEISDNTLKTEDDINSDFAVKMAKLRSGTHDTADKAG